MDKEVAENIQITTQGCIRELTMLMHISKLQTSEEEFSSLKSNIVQVMGRLIDIEEFNVYKEYPELRPYSLSD